MENITCCISVWRASLVLAHYARTFSLHQSYGYDYGREHTHNAPAQRDHLTNLHNMRTKKPIMSLGTINTILNTAPIVIQGATRLIKLIRDQGNENKPEEEIPETIEGIKNEVDRLHQRLDANDESNVEQIKLIEELARQNESLASQLKNTITQLNRITVLASIAILISIVCLAVILN